MSNISKIVNKVVVLKQLPIFSKLKWFELQKIANKCIFVEYKKGDIVCKQGAPPDAFYCLVSGRLKAYTTRDNGEKKDVEFLHHGMYFGIISLLTGENHSLTFEALNDSVILKIEKADFSTILDVVPRLGIEFSHSLSRRLRSRVLETKTIFESNILSIYSPIKDSGSSTYGMNLAFSLQKETKKKVLLVSISTGQDDSVSASKENETSPRWKKSGIPLRDIVDNHAKISQCISRGGVAIDLLHVTFDPQDLWLVGQISYFISHLATEYHFVIVDLPNEMDDVVFKTLTQSDIIHLVTRDKPEDLKLIGQVLERLKKTLLEKFNKDKIQVLISGIEQKHYLSYEEINRAIDYSVVKALPHIRQDELNIAVTSDDIAVALPDPKSEYAQVIRRIARQVGGVLVGLVLGGGAALGLAHIGVIRVLERENIPIDFVVGSSMGALIASLWVAGKNADDIEMAAREFESKVAMQKLLDFTFPKAGLIGGENITRWLRKHLTDKTFYNTRIPFKVVAYDLMRREELVIEEGSLVSAVRQSIAIPGVVNPIIKKDRLIIDGGVVNPLPVNVVAGMGINKVIAVNVLQSPYDVIRGYEFQEKKMQAEEKIPFTQSPMKYLRVRARRILTKLFYPNIADIIVRGLQAVEYVIAEQSASQADVVIHPDLVGVNWFELYEVNRLIKSGEEAAYRHLDEIKKLISE